jgi:hypothetical protein
LTSTPSHVTSQVTSPTSSGPLPASPTTLATWCTGIGLARMYDDGSNLSVHSMSALFSENGTSERAMHRADVDATPERAFLGYPGRTVYPHLVQLPIPWEMPPGPDHAYAGFGVRLTTEAAAIPACQAWPHDAEITERRVVWIGDSITANLPVMGADVWSRLRRDHPCTLNMGESSDSVQHARHRYVRTLDALRALEPTDVVLAIGTNNLFAAPDDLETGYLVTYPAQMVADAIRAFALRVAADIPDTRVLVRPSECASSTRTPLWEREGASIVQEKT